MACVGLLALAAIPVIEGCMASPYAFRDVQPDGNVTPPLFIRGGPMFHYMEDMDCYTVMQDDQGFYVYAKPEQSNGTMMPDEMIFGEVDPEEIGLAKNILPNMTMREQECGRMCQQYDDEGDAMSPMNGDRRNRALSSFNRNLPRKNLVLLLRFNDHRDRALPRVSDYEVLFNGPRGHSILGGSGSVRDVFAVNSYGDLVLESIVYDRWITLPNTEAHYADGQSGFTEMFLDALEDALNIVDGDTSFDFGDIDGNGDGTIDTLTLLHSGYGAEWGASDSYGQSFHDRIWSHQWSLPSSRHWRSRTGIRVNKYSVSPGLWGTSGSSIGRVGVIAHEIGHYLGLPDMYGGAMGYGVGSYGMMGNSWGHDGSQRWPPHFSAWAKVELGYVQPQVITQPGRYTLQSSATKRDLYRIDLSADGTEYLLIENRQTVEFDRKLPQGGLAIWHVDETTGHLVEAGFPGEPGWPENGNHYSVALLQADGNYDLERGIDRGDGGDVFHANGVDSIGPSDAISPGPFPNTDSYQGGIIKRSDVIIFDIGPSGSQMEFSISFARATSAPSANPTSSPVSLPTTQPVADVREIRTTFAGGNGAAGNMFDVIPLSNIELLEMEIHTSNSEVARVEIWTKSGSYKGFEKNATAWTMLLRTEIETNGRGKGTLLQLSPLAMTSQQRQAFYVSTTGGDGLRYTNGDGVGTVLAENDDLQILEGVGKTYPFGRTYQKRQWNGMLRYQLSASPITDPSEAPSSNPSEQPTTDDIPQMPMNDEQLPTTYAGGTQQAGNMFDILSFTDITITAFEVHLTSTEEVTLEIFTRPDSFVGFESNCGAWNKVATVKVTGRGKGKRTPVPLGRSSFMHVNRYQIQAFYITIKTSSGTGMRYTRGTGRGNLIASDSNLAIFEGVGKSYPCGSTFNNRVWNGVIHYTA